MVARRWIGSEFYLRRLAAEAPPPPPWSWRFDSCRLESVVMNPQINNFEYTFCVCFVLHFFIVCGRCWGWFGSKFGVKTRRGWSKRGAGGPKQAQNEVQVVPGGDSGDDFGTNKNQRHNTIITGTDLGSISGSFWTPKSMIFDIDFVLIFVMCFLSPLERFGVDFGALLVSK